VAFLASLPGVAGWAALALPGGYLVLITVLALVAALSTRPSRRQAAYRVLQLIWWPHQRPDDGDDQPAGPALPAGRRRRR
jgi:hypothetical protein